MQVETVQHAIAEHPLHKVFVMAIPFWSGWEVGLQHESILPFLLGRSPHLPGIARTIFRSVVGGGVVGDCVHRVHWTVCTGDQRLAFFDIVAQAVQTGDR